MISQVRSSEPNETYKTYRVSRHHRQPLLTFITEALEACGCRIIRASDAGTAPFRISFATPEDERMGIVAYAFLANSRLTTNRPVDEYRFQLKYGSKVGGAHEIWQDPYGLYTTLLVGISPSEGFFVGADPVLHNPTKHFISIELKKRNVEAILEAGWTSWERERRSGSHDPIEVLVGGRPKSFLDYVRFERDAVGEDQGHRQLLAERQKERRLPSPPIGHGSSPSPEYVHELTRELELTEIEVLDLITRARRLKMAVRGWVAEEHLFRKLRGVRGVTDCERLDIEGGADISLRFEGSDPLVVECKNVLRQTLKDGRPRVDFKRTRTSLSDPCTRYYGIDDFDVVAACTHAVTQRWEYSFNLPRLMDPHRTCRGKLSDKVVIDDRWTSDIRGILGKAARRGDG
ncbi:MAG TPA: hypothetical protein VFO89_12785 [Thermoanaerobaculia bacterium]|nr:hypothetical protein [Thermoanaerobaculia bacterium]